MSTVPHKLNALRVLLVDDDDFMLDVVEEMLLQLGIETVVRAHSGAEALTLTAPAHLPFQLVISDLDMPDIDGIQLVRHLADLTFEGAVIILSGADTRLLDAVGNLLREHKLNYLGAVQKPIDQADLLAQVMKVSELSSTVSVAARVQSHLLMLSVDELRAGLDGEAIEPFFQPKISASGHSVLGAECLLRWRHPERGLVSPLAVIPVAEAHGLIDELTLVLFTKVMAHLGEWTRQGHALKVSVNISMDSLAIFELPDLLAKIARDAGVEPKQVILEITESRLMNNLASSLEIISRFRLLGFGLSIDDFGTGYSSMEKLKQMPFTELKVDRAFVCGAASDPVASAIFKSSVDLGHALGMQVVAEGAETQEDWDLVMALGCDQLQGYVVAKPMPAKDFIDWKTSWDKSVVLAPK